LSDTEAACMDYDLLLCLKEKKFPAGQKMVQTKKILEMRIL
jgi:hypothetical protein